MTIRRIFVGSVVALLLSALSLGTACEISCSVAQNWSDCHSPLALDTSSDHSGTQMDGMDMSMGGISMPDMTNSSDQTAGSIAAAPVAGHPSFGEMGLCERQSCDNRLVASVRSARSNAPQFHSFLLVTDMPRAIGAPPNFRDARDDLAPYHFRNASPPTLSLRI